jgi:hypothetical protein
MIRRLENPERSISERPSRRSFLQGAGSLLAVAADWPRTTNTRPQTPLFKIDRISQHVYAAIAQTTPVVSGNSAIIVTKQGLVIVDSQSSPSAAHSLCNQFKREVADLPVRYVINTHHHLDHAHGNAAYLEMFGPQADIISTSFARAALKQAARWFVGFVQRRPVPSSQLEEVPNQERYYAFVESYIGGLREGLPKLEGRILQLAGEEQATAQRRLESLRLYFFEMAAFAPALPNITFDQNLRCTAETLSSKFDILGAGTQQETRLCSCLRIMLSLRVTWCKG